MGRLAARVSPRVCGFRRRDAGVPSIQGRAWNTGYVQHVVAPDDPFPTGLTVDDIWSTVQD